MNRYERYKDSGIPWLGEVPEHWNIIQFRRVVENIKDGTHGTHSRENNGFPLLSAKNVFNDGIHIHDNESQISEEDYKLITSNGFPRKNDLLITCVGSIGRCCVYPFDNPIAFQRSVAFLRLNKNSVPQFYKYFVESICYQEQLRANIKLSIQGGVYLGTLVSLYVSLPPQKEQTAIAHYLDTKLGEIDALIDKQQTLLEKLAEQRTAVITQAVTKGLNPAATMKNSGVEWLGDVPAHWEIKRLRFLCNIITGDMDTQDNEPNGQYPFYVRSEVVERSNEYSFDNEAVLMAGDGVGAGKVFHYVNGKYGCHQRVYSLSNFKQISGKFLYFYLKEFFKRKIEEGGAKSTVDSVRLPMLKDFTVCLPNDFEQNEIVSYISEETAKIDRLCDTVNQTIDRLKEYRTALITQAVTGKIKVTDE